MGNLCVHNKKKYNQIKTYSNESESEIKLEVFDINIAKQNIRSINIDSKKIYEKHMTNILPKLIKIINNTIQKDSSSLEDHSVIYIHQDNCDLKSIDRQYRKEEYDRFYVDKIKKDICEIYNKKGYKTFINSRGGYICISWK